MLEASRPDKGKPNYGWDAPHIMIGMLAIGSVLCGLGVALLASKPFPFSQVVGVVLAVGGAFPLVLGLAMFQYGLVGKLRTRDAIVNLVTWRGDEAVLDIGTGAGMLVIAAGKRLSRGGHAVGIDIWSTKDLSNNSAEAARRNIAIEAVEDRVEIRTEDVTRLSFPEVTFDVALSLLRLHNIEPKSDQLVACREIARVLKPGGRVVIGDYVSTHHYAEALRNAGLDVKRSRAAFGVAGALMWLLVADKPVDSARG